METVDPISPSMSFDRELCIYGRHNGNCVTAFCLSRSFSSRRNAVSSLRNLSWPPADFQTSLRVLPFVPWHPYTQPCSKGASTAVQSDGMLFHQRRNYKMVKQAHHITRPFAISTLQVARRNGMKALISEISPRRDLISSFCCPCFPSLFPAPFLLFPILFLSFFFFLEVSD